MKASSILAGLSAYAFTVLSQAKANRVVAGNAPSPTYTLYKTSALGAASLDGSPTAFYFMPSATGSDDWMFYTQGGGWCTSVEGCYNRTLTILGSSTQLPDTMTDRGGLLSSDCAVSPLCNYNKVFAVYTDGASFSGMRKDPLPVPNHNTTLMFRGRANLDSIVHAVKRNVMGAKVTFATARNVIYTGCSAGGLAVYAHADYLSTLLAPRTGTYAAIPMSVRVNCNGGAVWGGGQIG